MTLHIRCPHCGQLYPGPHERPFEHLLRRALEDRPDLRMMSFERDGDRSASVTVMLLQHEVPQWFTLSRGLGLPSKEEEQAGHAGVIDVDRALMQALADAIRNFGKEEP